MDKQTSFGPPAKRSKFGVWTCAISLFTVASTVHSFFPPQASRPGFLTIDCGSNEDSYDNSTGIYWQTDAKHLSTGTSFDGINIPGFYRKIIRDKRLSITRYFDGPRPGRNRDCYELPTKPPQTYILRPISSATGSPQSEPGGTITGCF